MVWEYGWRETNDVERRKRKETSNYYTNFEIPYLTKLRSVLIVSTVCYMHFFNISVQLVYVFE